MVTWRVHSTVSYLGFLIRFERRNIFLMKRKIMKGSTFEIVYKTFFGFSSSIIFFRFSCLVSSLSAVINRSFLSEIQL